MNFEDFDYVDSDRFSGKIILTSFPGLNAKGEFAGVFRPPFDLPKLSLTYQSVTQD